MQVRVVPDPVVRIDHTLTLTLTDDAATNEVSGKGCTDEITDVADRSSRVLLRDSSRHFICEWNIGRIRIIGIVGRGESMAEDATLHPDRDRAIDILHHERHD